MGFTTVPDKKDGDVFTEDMWDTLIRDNINWLGTLGVLGYKEFTANVTIPVNTALPSPVTVVALDPITFDGASVVEIDFWAPGVTDISDSHFYMYVNNALSGDIGTHQRGGDSAGGYAQAHRRFTPPAGAVTIDVRATAASNGAVTVYAGPGGAGQWMPGFLRCSYGQGRSCAVA